MAGPPLKVSFSIEVGGGGRQAAIAPALTDAQTPAK